MRLREAIFDLIAPYDCLMCSAEGTLVCAWCWPEMFEIAPEECFVCHKSSIDAAVCPQCRITTPLGHVWVVSPYRGGARALVRRMKIDAYRQACTIMARAMHESAPPLRNVVVTSVPTAASRIRERGFDHSRLIAEEFARMRQLPYRQLLMRHGNAKQAGASKTKRLQQISGSYQVYGAVPTDQQILIIDDVTTTGATLTEVAKVLRQAEAKDINGLVFAQTVR